jgi:hypothetical protein
VSGLFVRRGRVIIWPDTHFPKEHTQAFGSFLDFLAREQPALVIQIGDLLDVQSLARWSQDTTEENGQKFQHELDVTRTNLELVREVYDGPFAWIPGNHEERLIKWGRTRGRALYGLRGISVPGLLGMDDLGIARPVGDVEARAPFPFAHDTVAVHGERLGVRAAFSVDKEMTRFGGNVVMGHCHRLATVFRNVGDRATWGMEAGHLSDRKQADYVAYGEADWRMGFGVVDVDGKHTMPLVVPIRENGVFAFEGVKYGG